MCSSKVYTLRNIRCQIIEFPRCGRILSHIFTNALPVTGPHGYLPTVFRVFKIQEPVVFLFGFVSEDFG